MSTTIEAPQAASDHDEHEGHSDLMYWKVGGFLALLTALEVSTYWWEENTLTSAALIVMMIIKFVVVAFYFMHLKDDAKLLSQVFFAGLILGLLVYFGAMGAMLIFEDGGRNEFPDPPRDREVPEVIVESSALGL